MPSDKLVPGNSQPGLVKGKRLQRLLDFAGSLRTRLGASSAASDNQLLESLQTHIRTLHASCHKPSVQFSGNAELDDLGTAIWNLSTRLLRDGDDAAVNTERRRLATRARVFAFHLLDAAQQLGEASIGNKVRLIRLALKAGKSSIEASELELAGFVLQKGADYVSYFGEQRNSLGAEDAKDVRGLEAEYYILRTALSWKEDRLDVAEHMYNKGHLTDQSFDPHYAEKLADVLYEVGKDMITRKDFQMAVKWLDRAQEMVNSHEIDQLSCEGVELRTAIMQAHITALTNIESAEGFTKADNLILFLQSEMGSTMLVLLLKLELLTKAPGEIFDSNEYATILGHMITCFKQKDLGDGSAGQSPGDPDFRLIFHHIGKLHEKSPELGCAVLDELILAIAKSDHDEWIERLVTKRIWMAAHRAKLTESVEAAEVALSHIQKPLGADATVAVQTLIWKTLDSAYNKQEYEVAEQWCKLALHRVFENTGPLNRAKIERKHLICALARNNMDGARSVFHSMAEDTQKEPRTLFLMYKIAVRSDDREEATRCIEAISKVPEPVEYLYACCLDAHNAPRRDFAIEALTKLLKKNEHSPSSPVQLPALLRCTVRLVAKNMEGRGADGTSPEEVAQKLCGLFNEVVANIQREPRDVEGNKLFDINELDWFARNAYNLGIKHLDVWDVSETIQILTSCNAIMSHFPADISSEMSADIALKTLFNNFIIASGLIARARANDNGEDQLQDYLLMRRHIAAFDDSLPGQLPLLVEACRADMLSKLACLLTFEFEGALALKSFDDLCPIVRKCADSASSALSLQAMADCLLRHPSVPTQTVYSTLRAIVNALSALDEGLDHVRLSRYMRCLFQVTLPFDEGLALVLAGEYVEMMTEAVRQKVPPPEEETEWLAATAFNHAAECYWSNRDEDCKRWAFRAFEMARLVPDGGQLEEVLHGRFFKLKFDAK